MPQINNFTRWQMHGRDRQRLTLLAGWGGLSEEVAFQLARGDQKEHTAGATVGARPWEAHSRIRDWRSRRPV